eukprot:gb/GFBE01012928.1/.p1 GENE.gb/GFBE01012928.1/~~gb/GFBE01012928.1/.p1  ORF type:complete len:341 (+),score=92.95 gb/GFBE01012928.1/:1-1023(+)
MASSTSGGYQQERDQYTARLKKLQALQQAQANGPLEDLVASVMQPAPPEAFSEKTKEELAAMSKEERTAYHKAKLAAAKAKAQDSAEPAMSKAEKRTQAREKQEADRRRKEEATHADSDDRELLAQLKLQGLTDDQAKEFLAQMKESKVTDDADSDDDDAAENLVDSVRAWMSHQGETKIDSEALRDFNLKVRFQGFVETTPPDHLGAMLEVIASQACAGSDLLSKQPAAVADHVRSTMSRWTFMLDQLYSKCDALKAADIVVSSVRAGVAQSAKSDTSDLAKDCALVGILMALRDEVDAVTDEDLLTGCSRLDSDSKVVQGFMDHLEEADEDSDEEEEV